MDALNIVEIVSLPVAAAVAGATVRRFASYIARSSGHDGIEGERAAATAGLSLIVEADDREGTQHGVPLGAR